VANIFGSVIGKVQEKMLKMDISQVQDHGDTFFSSTDMAYLVFMIIGIVGYFTVPSVANYIVHAGGGNAFGQKVTSLFHNSSKSVMNTATGSAGMVADAMGNAAGRFSNSMSNNGNSSGYFHEGGSGDSKYMQDKISGK
jgi:hypothetical protein